MSKKYPLAKELKFLEHMSLIPNIHIYPFINIFVGLIPCKSDDKVSVTKIKTPGYEGYKLSTLVIEPKGCSEKLPCIVFYHGGGIILKAMKAHYQFAKWYAEKAKSKVILPDYRLMPKYRFPYAAEDCYSTYKWVLDNADELNIDKSRIIVTGDSAGGYLSTAVFLMARDRNLTLPAGVLLVYPVLDRHMATDSMKKYTDTPVFNSKLAQMYWTEYLKTNSQEKIEYASPMEASSYAGFPETYIEVAEFDCLHDEGIIFAERLKAEGFSVELHEVKGSCHGFEVALKSPMVKEALERRINFINRIFKKHD